MNVIEVKNLSKKYLLRRVRGDFNTLRDLLQIKNIFKKKEDYFWSLKDVNFTVKKGGVIGLIGANGAGKSTLLKILSRIVVPTEGSVVIHGKTASILEVGTGFHPELTGRENVYLNGAILGMHRKEVDEKIAKIIDFSGIGKFIDTPVKYYSSGMYTRIAFSVIAYLDIDILLIDEVLAVGDLDFQKKSLKKMQKISEDKGKTIFFVSHNMNAIKKICKKTIFLDNGSIKNFGETNKVVKDYLKI